MENVEAQKKKEEDRLTKLENIKQLAALKKSQLAEEPAEDAEGITTIKFRDPSKGNSYQRRFLKTDTIQILYDFIQSRIDEIELEDDESTQFELIQNMPHKVFDDMSLTLDSQGLFPRAVLQNRDVESEEE